MDSAIRRQIGITLLIIAGGFGAVLLEHFILLEWSPMWLWFIGISWYAIETLIGAIIYHYFKVTKADIPDMLEHEEETVIKLTPVEAESIETIPVDSVDVNAGDPQ